MKVSAKTHFSNPVLMLESDDYKTSEFSVDIKATENIGNGALKITYFAKLTEKSILESFTSGKSSFVFYIKCLDTGYYREFNANSLEGHFEIEKGSARGKIFITPLFIAKEKFVIESENLNEEYGSSNFEFHENMVLAYAGNYKITAGRDKLAPFESIFDMSIDESVPEGQFKTDCDNAKITLFACRKTYTDIFNLRQTGPGKVVSINCVFLPVVMDVLYQIQQDPDSFKEKSWFSVFESKCSHLGINLVKPDILGDAQKILDSPLVNLLVIIEGMV